MAIIDRKTDQIAKPKKITKTKQQVYGEIPLQCVMTSLPSSTNT